MSAAPDRRGRARTVALTVWGAVAVAVGATAVEAQVGGVWSSDAHTCGDCHGTHDAGPGRSGLVRPGRSDVTPQAPGIGPVSERCLLCHGVPGDRVRAVSDRPVPGAGGVFLGGSLSDDHPLGVVVVDGIGSFPDPGGSGSDLPHDTPGFESGNSIECVSCHDPHDPWLATQQAQHQDEGCIACHAPEYDTGGHGVASCGSCHRLHAAPRQDVLVREPTSDYLCGACHRGAPAPLHEGIEPIAATPLHDDPADVRCAGCHRIH